ncbi:MAG TPA: hypothetical protein DIW31_12465 [Bacteroidales bacterium]|nr:hypothetical protein [Bacteroidales bacterium]
MVRHYLEKRIGKGEHPVYIALCYKRKVTQIKSAIVKRYSSNKLMLRECKGVIEQEAAQIKAIVRDGERLNPNYSIYDFTKLLRVSPTNRLETLTKQFTTPSKEVESDTVKALTLQKNEINRRLREIKKQGTSKSIEPLENINITQEFKQLSLF